MICSQTNNKMFGLLPFITAVSITIAVVAVLYKLIRPRFPVKVNCWFCNKDTTVPYENKNCFDCPSCEQYNGFTTDGDYNKAIPAQTVEEFNYPTAPEQGEFNSSSNILCALCQRNQYMKVKLMAEYQPMHSGDSEDNSFADEKAEFFRKRIEEEYKLCQFCERKARQQIEKQDQLLRQKLQEIGKNIIPAKKLNDSSFNSSKESIGDDDMCSAHLRCRLATPLHVKFLRFTAILCAFVLFVANADHLLEVSDVSVKPNKILPVFMCDFLHLLFKASHVIVGLGLATEMAAVYLFGKDGLCGIDAVASVIWVVLLVLHSNIIQNFVDLKDIYILQSVVSFLAFFTSLWCAECPRLSKMPKRRIRLRKYESNSLNNSVSSQRSQNTSTQESPVLSVIAASSGNNIQTQRLIQAVSGDNMDANKFKHNRDKESELDKLETLSLGSPIKSKRKKSGGIFSHYSLSATNLTSTGINNFQQGTGVTGTLGQRRPLISPARFSPRPGVPHGGGRGSSLPPRELFDKSVRDNYAFGDTRSVFSEPQLGSREDPLNPSFTVDESVSQNSEETSDVSCLDVKVHKDPRKTSAFNQVLLGLSIGINLAVLCYFTLDYKQVKEMATKYAQHLQTLVGKMQHFLKT